MNTRYLSTPLSKIADTNLLSLIVDLEQVTGVRRTLNYNMPFGMYLHDCLRPNGSEYPPILITPKMLRKPADLLILNKSICKFNDTALYWLCVEIALSRKISIEDVLTKKVYVFINQSYKDSSKKKRKKGPTENRLWR